MRIFMTSLRALMLTIAMVLSNLSLADSGAMAEEEGDSALFAAYDQVNSADIEIAELGVIRGASPEVRAVAAMVLRDHSVVRQMARQIAADLNIAYEVADNDEAAEQHKLAREHLGSLSGPEFDQAYLKHEAAFHRSAIEAVRTVLIPSTNQPRFQKHLETVLPGFEHHLKSTLETADALGYDIE